jgi:hypothetical protein
MEVDEQIIKQTSQKNLKERWTSSTTNLNAQDKQHHMHESDLWTDKYKPKQVLDLLNEQKTVRALLGWIFNWKTRINGMCMCVFCLFGFVK